MKHAAFVVLLALSLCMLFGTLGPGAHAEELWAPDELIVKFIPGSSASQKSALISGYKIKDLTFIGAEVWHVNGQPVEDAVAALNSSPIVEYAEPNYFVYAFGIPNDPLFGLQWNMHNTGQTVDGVAGIEDADIDAPEAWDLYTGSSSVVVVAVLDSGVDFNHPDLAGRIWLNSGEIPENGFDDDSNGYPDDVRGWNFFEWNNDVSDVAVNSHGTQCAGIIGAVGNNGTGIAGVNWGVSIMPVRIMSSGTGLATSDRIVNAIDYAVTMGADVINASWGGYVPATSVELAIRRAQAADVFFVAAAGNGDHDTDVYPAYPACYPGENIISVMATDHRDARIVTFEHRSNYGATSVDIAAPGLEVYSTARNNSYESGTGTSMAAPQVSGAMAMLRGLSSNITVEQGKALLLELGCDELPSLAGLCVSGSRLNLRKLVEAPDATAPAQIADLTVGVIGSSWIELHWTATGDDGPVGRALAYDVRFATSAIVTEADWDAASRAGDVPDPQASGAPETVRVPRLAASTTYHFAIRALDEANRGAISNCPNGTTLGPPTIAAPTSLSAILTIGSSESQSLQIANVGEGTLDYRIGQTPTWLSVAPNAGSVPAGGSTNLTLTFDSAGVPLGVYTGVLRIVSNDLASPIWVVQLTLEVVNYSFDDNAVYRFRAGSADTSHVLAISMTSPPEFAQITADLTAVAGPASVALSDDGTGEDVKAGDGIFTSPRFAASMPAVGTYVASVTALPVGGTLVTQSINMFAVTAAAKFTGDSEFDETERLGDALALGLAARPYSSVYFRASPNDDESKSVMVTTFDDNATPPGIWGRSLQFDGSEGRFDSRGSQSEESWVSDDLPLGSRGVCYADFDNDGDTDFFICNPTGGGKLFVNYLNDANCPAAWQGKFINRTSAICGADSVYLAGAITASWGDYTGDGFADLFVATGSYVEPIEDLDELPMQASGFNGGDMRLFKNNMGAGLRKSLIWGSGSSPLCLAACWLDLDDDGDLDLVTTRYMNSGLSVLENHGINAAHTDQLMEQVTWTPSVADLGANSITVIDYDHDSHLDLLVTESSDTRKQAWILRNNYGSGYSKSFAAIGFGEDQAWSGAVAADLNLDGQDDIVLLPRSADVVPALFMSSGYMLTPVFEEPWPAIPPIGEPTTPTYRDLGYTLGIRDGKTGGGFATDLDGDHAPDLFLGRDMVDSQGQSSGEQCLYRSTGSAGTTNHRLQVNLRTRGDSNGSLIGTKVQVVAGGKQLMKAVDGGSFRGGQGTNDLLFGLGGETSIAQVSVVFPSGETKIISQPAIDSALEVWEDDMDVLAYARPASALELQPGFMDWIFRWKTGSIKGDLREDKLEIYPYGGDPQDAVVLQWGAPNVSNVVYRESGVWTHEMRLGGLQCFEGARWTFRVSSSAGTGGETIALSAWSHTPAVTYCLPENYGQ